MFESRSSLFPGLLLCLSLLAVKADLREASKKVSDSDFVKLTREANTLGELLSSQVGVLAVVGLLVSTVVVVAACTVVVKLSRKRRGGSPGEIEMEGAVIRTERCSSRPSEAGFSHSGDQQLSPSMIYRTNQSSQCSSGPDEKLSRKISSRMSTEQRTEGIFYRLEDLPRDQQNDTSSGNQDSEEYARITDLIAEQMARLAHVEHEVAGALRKLHRSRSLGQDRQKSPELEETFKPLTPPEETRKHRSRKSRGHRHRKIDEEVMSN
ncbi:unnamed protein product [Cyprideis torosa]|uniref:Uncharacterized protein n=1 Tax=Cyprideis torosa TaxID=163714 RepID=A0A7R8W2B6_9CRUS|nr:unnamed protein product [Cyprideis torosa]CAG0879586.1 unnamed protein product [Cyprideis torosa]